MLLTFFLSTIYFSGLIAQNFEIYHKWDFENEEPGSYSASEIREDFDVNTLWATNSSIVTDVINGQVTKVLQVTHEANRLANGFDLNANLKPSDEVYLSYNIKFSNEFNSTQAGKMPGFQGSPNLEITDGHTCMGDDEGFIAVPCFKKANYLICYNFNRTRLPDCIWSSDEYENTIVDDHYFLNGVWYNVVQRIRMNTFTNGVANADGINEIWVDGKLKIQEVNQIFNVTEGNKVDLLGFVSFYGGVGFEFTPQSECYTYFDNIVVYNPKDDLVKGNQPHSLSEIIRTPSEITDRNAYYDTFINKESDIHNKQYGDYYSPCIDEVYLIDAGAGNKVSVTLDWTLGGGDYLFFIDGKRSDSRLIRKVEGWDVSSDQTITSEGQYMLIRFSSNTDIGSLGFLGQIKFLKEGVAPKPDNPGNTIYVDPENANDPAEDGSLLHPFDSWEDITWSEGKNYLQKCGTSCTVNSILIGASNITMGSYGSGEKPVIESQTTEYVIHAFDKHDISINNLSIKGIKASSLINFLGTTSNNVIIEYCLLESSLNAIKIMDGLDFTIRYNLIKVGNEAINSTSRSNNIYYNIFKENSVALIVNGNSSAAHIYNNLFLNNSEAISASANLTICNNIFYLADRSISAIRYSGDNLLSDYNIFYPEKNSFVEINSIRYDNLKQLQQIGIEEHSLNSDPKLVDINAENFELESFSPAINAGISVNLQKDYYGRSVPFLGLPDIGIYEYSGIHKPSDPDENDPTLILVPNPASDHVNIVVQLPESIVSDKSEIRIVDLQGKELFSKILTSDQYLTEERIDLSGIANGMYLVVFYINEKQYSKKLIILK